MKDIAPTGIVTLVFTDIEGSTVLWEVLGEEFMAALDLHNRVIRTCLAAHDGYEVKTEGDAFMIAFSRARDAVLFCLDAQRRLHDADWPQCLDAPEISGLSGTSEDTAFRGLRVRMGTHSCNPVCKLDPLTGRGDYFGVDVNRAARLAHSAHGGQVLISASTWSTLDPLDLAVMVDLGEHALRGLETREHVRQLLPSGLSDRSFPRLKTPELRKTNLPARVDSFIGRQAVLDDLTDRIERGQRLITIVGAGGLGKTRLSQRFAAEQLANFPGGTWFCDLTEARSHEGFVNAVGQALGVRLTSTDTVDQLGTTLVQRGRVLVVLDNFEQVADHAAKTVGTWIERAEHAVFLVTSRIRLDVRAEHILELKPHTTDEAVQLFKERATVARPDFSVHPGNQSVIRQIVDKLDDLALAVELAAARVRLLTPEQILQRLDQRFVLLRSTRRDHTARQTTLRGAIDWSWDLLRPWEQLALAQCSVFRGGFTLDAAEAVLDLGDTPEDILDVIQALVDHSLVRSWSTANGQMRLGLFESIHEYAAEKLASVEHAVPPSRLRLRHAEHYARLGTDEHLDALFSHGGVEKFGALTLDLENVLAGAERALDLGEHALAVRCALATAVVYQRVGPAREGLAVLDRVLKERALKPASKARLSWRKAEALRRLGRPKEALNQMESARQFFSQLGDRRNLARVVGGQAILHYGLGDLERARQNYEAALAGHREAGDRQYEGQVLANLANFHGQNDAARAIEYFEQALTIHREVGNRGFEGSALGNLACLKQAQGQVLRAREHFEAALEIHREVGNLLFEGIDLGNLGTLLLQQGEVHEADEALTASIEILDELWPVEAAEKRGVLAVLRARADRLKEAHKLMDQAEKRLRPDHPWKLARLLCRRAIIAHEAGDHTEANRAHVEAADLATAVDAGHSSTLFQMVQDLHVRLNAD